MLIHGIFFLITVQTAQVQYPPQHVDPMFPNHSQIVESTTAEAALLTNLLKVGNGCVVFLYNHKSWKSQQVAQVLQNVASKFFNQNDDLKWFAINCSYNKCGDHFRQESLPQIQYYVKVSQVKRRFGLNFLG